MPTAADINKRNAEFWSAQNLRTEALSADHVVLETALDHLRSEELRGVPVYHRKTLEAALEDADRTRARFKRQNEANLWKTSELQSKRAKMRAAKLTGSQVVREAIEALALDPRHHRVPAKRVWGALFPKLGELGLHPIKQEDRRDPLTWCYWYRYETTAGKISFKRFSNLLSEIRKSQESR